MLMAEGDSDRSAFVEGFAVRASSGEGTLQGRFASTLEAGVQKYWNFHGFVRNMHSQGDFDGYADV